MYTEEEVRHAYKVIAWWRSQKAHKSMTREQRIERAKKAVAAREAKRKEKEATPE